MVSRRRTIIACKLRRDATDVERILWHALRTRASFWKFRRQHLIGPFVVDFACPARKLVIELDGGQHVARKEADAARSAKIARYGYRVIRFWNNEVVENLDGVLRVVFAKLEASPPHPGPLRPTGAEREMLVSARADGRKAHHTPSPATHASQHAFASARTRPI
jgi:very-short-patch-repair endonuclease